MLAFRFHSGLDYRTTAAQTKVSRATVGRIFKTAETEATAALAGQLGKITLSPQASRTECEPEPESGTVERKGVQV